MPYFQADRYDRLTLPSNPDYYVIMKRKARYGDTRAAQSAAISSEIVTLDSEKARENFDKLRGIDRENNTAYLVTLNQDASMDALLLRLIVEWNLDDEEGCVLPITLETINQLADEDGIFLLKEATQRSKGRSERAEGPFGKGSSVSSSEGSPATLTLPGSTRNSVSVGSSDGRPLTSTTETPTE